MNKAEQLPISLMTVAILFIAAIFGCEKKPEHASTLNGDAKELTQNAEFDAKDAWISLSDEVRLELVRVPQGQFMMGSPKEEIGYPEQFLARIQNAKGRSRPADEGPVHKVEIDSPFYMGKYEVTCRQYRCFKTSYQLLQHERRYVDGDSQPALVSWSEAIAFCEWVSQKTGMKVRLPSEAKWEYACRAGAGTRFFWGEDEKRAGEYANLGDGTYEKAKRGDARPLDTVDGQVVSCGVGKFKPNAFGLYDMLGNVPEWCEDEYFENAYDPSFVKSAPSEGRAYRGGGWFSDITTARCASRQGGNPNVSGGRVGFRVLVEDAK
jgi:formylglycine-generating enzyme required for sulfatase activity